MGFNKKKMFKVSDNESILDKISRWLWSKIRGRLKGVLYLLTYKSYWHYLFHKNDNVCNVDNLYYAAWPNQGAGLGHQLDVWCSGPFIARDWKLKFAYLPFSKKKWDKFLGFGEGEISVEELKRRGFVARKLPLFDVHDNKSIDLNKKIISSYSGKKIVFIAEVDQPYIYTVEEKAEFIKFKFISAPSRADDMIVLDKDNYNITIHIRRGDIMSDPNNPNLVMRYLSNAYYEKVLQQVLEILKVDKPIHIYVFSQGTPDDFPEFNKYDNLHWCFDVSAQNSFVNMVYSDMIITSKSSFSYDPALMNEGIKLCPKSFWGHYPKSKEWILCEDDGTFDNDDLREVLNNIV